MRILGIDPGIRNTGWGVVDIAGTKLTHVANGVITPNPKLPDADRLRDIADGVSAVIAAHNPAAAAIEEIFVAKSAASALKLGMARGVAMMVCGQHGLSVREIAARLVKKTVTGTGTADKRQMQDMVARLLNVTAANHDAADALAIAIAAGNDAGHVGGAGVGLSDERGSATASSNLTKAIEAALARDQQQDRNDQ